MTARDAALRALLACRKDGAWSDGALKQLLGGMEPREAALASRLCYGVLQNRMLLDHWLKPFVRGKLQPAVEEILRLAVYQLTFLDKIPPSAAVNEAVGQAKRFANPAAARLARKTCGKKRPMPLWSPAAGDIINRSSCPSLLRRRCPCHPFTADTGSAPGRNFWPGD